MEKVCSEIGYVVKHPDGLIFESTHAKTAYESQLKLVTGLLFPILENNDPATQIDESVVQAVWSVAARAGYETVVQMDPVPPSQGSEKNSSGARMNLAM